MPLPKQKLTKATATKLDVKWTFYRVDLLGEAVPAAVALPEVGS